jgi:hypothetical protein
MDSIFISQHIVGTNQNSGRGEIMAEKKENIGEVITRAKPRFKIPKVGFKFSRFTKLLVLVIGLLVLAYNLVFVYVKPNEFGIKVVRLGINRGVQKEIYTAGLHLLVPGLQQMHTLPRDAQVLELTAKHRAGMLHLLSISDLVRTLNKAGFRRTASRLGFEALYTHWPTGRERRNAGR